MPRTLAQVDLASLALVDNTCFFETSEFYGSLPAAAQYETDLSLLNADTYTKETLKTWQGVDFKQQHRTQAVKICARPSDQSLVGMQLQLAVPGQ